jgi:hypothetical protein
VLGLILRLGLDVRAATLVGAALAGEPQIGPLLVEVARRESRLQLVGIHAIDSRWSAQLRPAGCEGQAGWSTRGAHGMMAAYALPYLPAVLRCSPWVLDVPLVSAYAAARRATGWRCRQHPRCRAWLVTP